MERFKKTGLRDGASSEWEESKHPRDESGKFSAGGGGKPAHGETDLTNVEESGTIKLPDEVLPKSVGAMWRNHEIRLPGGENTKFVEGSKLQNIEVFAGKGTKTTIRNEDALIKNHGGTKGNWQKVKGVGMVYDEHGEERKAELHWYQEQSVGKADFKVKEWEK